MKQLFACLFVLFAGSVAAQSFRLGLQNQVFYSNKVAAEDSFKYDILQTSPALFVHFGRHKIYGGITAFKLYANEASKGNDTSGTGFNLGYQLYLSNPNGRVSVYALLHFTAFQRKVQEVRQGSTDRYENLKTFVENVGGVGAEVKLIKGLRANAGFAISAKNFFLLIDEFSPSYHVGVSWSFINK